METFFVSTSHVKEKKDMLHLQTEITKVVVVCGMLFHNLTRTKEGSGTFFRLFIYFSLCSKNNLAKKKKIFSISAKRWKKYFPPICFQIRSNSAMIHLCRKMFVDISVTSCEKLKNFFFISFSLYARENIRPTSKNVKARWYLSETYN